MQGTESSQLLQKPDDLLALFHGSETPREQWLVGTEAEKFGLYISDMTPIQYEGDHKRPGVRELMATLASTHGWRPEREYEGGAVVALKRDGASITLEPGAQLELSGAPFANLHETSAEFALHHKELQQISEPLGLRWYALGFHPTAAADTLPWVPKLRYRVMRHYFPTTGQRGTDMMGRTATVQANLDYSDSEDAFRKLRIGLRLQPVVSVIFANSPFINGSLSGVKSERARVWWDVDPSRSGLLPWAWDKIPTYHDYIEWALDAPMFMVKRGGELHRNTGQSFRSFMADGFGELRATHGDWQAHVNTLFPEVRIKNTLEFRTADSVPLQLVSALPALWKGLLYDAKSMDAIEQLTSEINHEAAFKAQHDADLGYATMLASRPIGSWADAVLDLAREGLGRLGQDEARLLEPLRVLVNARRCPADDLLDAYAKEGCVSAKVLESAEASTINR
jgi:glutamate--cysteine ligase